MKRSPGVLLAEEGVLMRLNTFAGVADREPLGVVVIVVLGGVVKW